MLMPVFSGKKYGCSRDAETGEYLLHDNQYRSRAFLRGGDAEAFGAEIALLEAQPVAGREKRKSLERIIAVFL